MNKRLVLGARIKTIQNKILGIKKEELPAKQAESAETAATIAPTANKKEIISKLRDKIRLDIKKPKISKKPRQGYIKHFSADGDALRKHGFKIKVPGEKEPEPKYIMPKSISHTKLFILNHFKEVYKHG